MPFRSPLRLTLLAALAWTMVLGASLAWNLDRAQRQMFDQAHAEAQSNLNKDITFRRWANNHGGVYVPITEFQQSSPWLTHVPGRDVITTGGLKLTLLNPATMLRQMMDLYALEYGIQGRITGLKQLNPGNAPDAWETEQLQVFTRGEKTETWAETNVGGKPHLRYLRAMFMERGCEKCHAILGYKLGDMRGATGLNLPLAPYYQRLDATRLNLELSHGAIWLLGLAGIGWGGWSAHGQEKERRRAEQALRASAEALHLYANAFRHSGEAIMITDRDNRIIAVNPAFSTLTGYSGEEVLGRNPKLLASGRTPPEIYQGMWAALRESGFWQGEFWDRRKDGQIYPKWAAISLIRDEHGQITHHFASFTDISERKAAEERIHHLAHHDALTGLLNRFSLETRLEQTLLSARRENREVAVLFIDMDRFKTINDTLGHHIGDLLLMEVAHRLLSCVRESDIVARLGGDEFVVVLTGLESAMDAAHSADKIVKLLCQTYLIEHNDLHTSPSVGISTFPGDGSDPETLMKHADTAMYHAKERGRKNYQFFTASMTTAALEKLALERDLRAALDERQFELHYQPKICTADGSTCGVEALVRWRHPEKGLIPPLKFIPIAEESGLIEALGEWVLDEACRQQAAWRDMGIVNARVAVNLSALQLRSPLLVEKVRAIMEKHAITDDALELEVTESAAMENPESAIGQLNALRKLGVTLSIDDFGTGYSSLAYLKLLPIQTLKLDRAFVSDIESDENDAAISAATLALAHNLGIKVVAEGVETEGQRAFLATHRCDYLQGYLFSKPLPAQETTTFLLRGTPQSPA
jgi:diguanylate cyclase (GGDEF)-like protein/PAS domain S-box-containing protein